MARRRKFWRSLLVFLLVGFVIVFYRWTTSSTPSKSTNFFPTLWRNLLTKNNFPATCTQKDYMMSSSADMDTAELYPKLHFEVENGNSGFWNRTFEERYLRIKETWKEIPLEVIVVPHSHADPGWLKTFDEYFNNQVSPTLNNMLQFMSKTPDFTFIWSEISFFSKWFDLLDSSSKDNVRALIRDRRLEIVTGGWVMSDEANAHYWAIIDQLVEGHQWLKTATGFIPTHGWSVDVFGHSGTIPLLLSSAGVQGMVIMRIHYAWKAFLSNRRQLDFYWSQVDNANNVLCHMAPSELYSPKYTCGPDSRICLQFDFRRINGEYSESISTEITNENIRPKASLLLDQYGRFASLFPHNVLLVPLGDDFRYNVYVEWEQQYQNYAKLFKYINSHNMSARVRFGTVSDYFEEVGRRIKNAGIVLPTIKGDFVPYADTYADGFPSYWTGYYTTRPYVKSLIRELEHWLRTAEITYSLARSYLHEEVKHKWSMENRYLVQSRKALALLQHHDAITGTSKTYVMEDYTIRLHEAIKSCMGVVTLASQCIMVYKPMVKNIDGGDGIMWTSKLFTDVIRTHAFDQSQKLTLTISENGRKIIVFNSLTFPRREFVRIRVKSLYLNVWDIAENKLIPFQINPVWSDSSSMRASVYEIIFICDIKPLTYKVYTLVRVSEHEWDHSTKAKVSFSIDDENKFYNKPSSNFPFSQMSSADDISVQSPKFTVKFSKNGLPKTIYLRNEGSAHKFEVGFFAYHSVPERSGAYLFEPMDRNPVSIMNFTNSYPLARVIRGKLVSEISFCLSPVESFTTRIPHVEGIPYTLNMENTVDIYDMNPNIEMVMRITSDIDSKGVFYTDSNGFQMLKRTYVRNIPIQGNYYPATSSMYIEDFSTRLNLLFSHSLGVTSPSPGVLEVMLDRRIHMGDRRGLDEGILDNKRTTTSFRVLLEPMLSNFVDIPMLSTSGWLSSKTLLYPLVTLAVDTSDAKLNDEKTFLFGRWPVGYHMLNLRTLPSKSSNIIPSNSSLLIISRQDVLCSVENQQEIVDFDTLVDTLRVNVTSSVRTTLTGVKELRTKPDLSRKNQYFQSYNITFS